MLHETKPFKNTWLGVPGEAIEFRTVRTMPLCKRVVTIRWPEGNPNLDAEPGDVTYTVITGDGRDPSHVVHDRGLLKDPDYYDLVDFAGTAIEAKAGA